MKSPVLAALVAAAMLGCGSDDEPQTLVKWRCGSDCDSYDVCAGSESDALGAARCTGSSGAYCKTTGDICACPEGGESCAIVKN